MMKKLLIFGLTICMFITTFFNGFSQKNRFENWFGKKVANKTIQYTPTYPYSLTVSTRNYAHLENPVSISDSIVWDDPQYLVKVGFDFEFMGISVDTIVVGDSYISLDYQLIYDEEWNQYYYENYGGIDVFGTDLIDFGYADASAQSHINYKLEGTEGERILKIEWKHVGFYYEYDANGESQSYISFQLWLFEEDNHFEIRYGESSLLNENMCYNNELGPYVDFGRTENDYELIHGYYLDGQPSGPIMLPINFDFDETLDDTPQNGTTYFFTVGEGTTIGIKDNIKLQNFEVFPNPGTGIFSIKSKEYKKIQVQVFDILGNKILDQVVDNYAKLDISKAPKGTYIVHAVSDNKVISTQKLIKN